jgi:AcrR family transcriptional regulator
VAEDAGVDSALVIHYFASKEGLFRAAIEWPLDLDERTKDVLEGDPETMGERLVRMVCQAWDDDCTRHPLTVVFRNAVQREGATRMAADFIEREMIGRLVAHTKDPTAALRGSLAHSAILGMIIARYVVGVEPLASLPTEQVVALVGPAVQGYLTGDLGLRNVPLQAS